MNMSQATLTCNATGNPSPNVTIYKDEKLLKAGLKHVMVEFQPVTVNHTGWYTCEAFNVVGKVDKKTYLDVQYAPIVSITTGSTVNVWLGKVVQTKCQATGNPVPNVMWYKDDRIMSYTADLNINITSKKQIGIYQCVAWNIRGNTSREVLFNRTRFCPGVTKITNNMTDLTSPNLTLIWSKPDINGSPITSYYIRKQQIYKNGTKGLLECSGTTSPPTRKYFFVLSWGAKYQFYVVAKNGQGETNGQPKTFTVIEEPTIQTTTIAVKPFPTVAVAGGAGAFVFILFVICLVCCIRRKSTNQDIIPPPCRKQSNFNHSMLMDELSSSVSPTTPSERYQGHLSLNSRRNTQHQDEPFSEQVIYDNVAFVDKSVEGWEIPRNNVCIEKIIGKGAFCQVAKAFVTGLGTVAVKMIRGKGDQSSNRKDLLEEYKLLQHLGQHDNVILVLGGVTITDPVMVLFEYVPYGDLLGYLRRSRGLTDTYYSEPDNPSTSSLSSKQLLRFAREIADGMAFISSKKIIHRDLAARNVLVGQGETCKITDFGMARDVKHNDDIYRKKKKGRLPVKWTAYEALLYGFYSTQSDVWSYAIVLYEIFTIGGSPYPDIEHRHIAEKIYKGYRMPKPKHLDDEIYALMTECWRTSPDLRPSFESLRSTLKRLEKHEKEYVHMNDYEKDLYANLAEI
ncbi:tyrosine-protein kinase receptor Tie-1 [Exaiptasia diaphana]|uniref:receptor protein-tyrosine kinase n=1 Tax=Exaiptasia diaphana TaxID=2652724 RepID=A0A913XRL3_EXADI|nr:tyrosine-protein kinase receptor Tie-1 [Exaiptasia diaphana]